MLGAGETPPPFLLPSSEIQEGEQMQSQAYDFSSTPLSLELEGSDQGLEKGQKKKMLIQNEKPGVEG